MSLICKRAVVFSVTSLLGLLVTACGESKVSQCNKLVGIANKATTEIQTTNQSQNPDKIGQLDKIAGGLEQYAKEMQGVELKDEKLQEFRSRFVQLYQQTSKGSRDVATALRNKNAGGANQALKQIQTGISQEQTLIGEVNQYCRGS
jgi:hypothetical protein